MADRTVFQVFEADIERLAFVESQSERSGDTILCAADIGDFIAEVQARLSKNGKAPATAQAKKSRKKRKREEQGRKSGGMDKKHQQNILRIVENKQKLADNTKELIG